MRCHCLNDISIYSVQCLCIKHIYRNVVRPFEISVYKECYIHET